MILRNQSCAISEPIQIRGKFTIPRCDEPARCISFAGPLFADPILRPRAAAVPGLA